MSVSISLRGMLRLIQVNTLRRVHTVYFLAERLILIQEYRTMEVKIRLNECSFRFWSTLLAFAVKRHILHDRSNYAKNISGHADLDNKSPKKALFA